MEKKKPYYLVLCLVEREKKSAQEPHYRNDLVLADHIKINFFIFSKSVQKKINLIFFFKFYPYSIQNGIPNKTLDQFEKTFGSQPPCYGDLGCTFEGGEGVKGGFFPLADTLTVFETKKSNPTRPRAGPQPKGTRQNPLSRSKAEYIYFFYN